jgi:cell division ATPase FtsA
LDKLHGGIILTGGGSQLKHLTQLTEYKTGLSCRIGFPNEHLAAGYKKELMLPMYATCIGLILRGYDDYEHNRLRFISNNSEDTFSYDKNKLEGKVTETLEPAEELSAEQLLAKEFGEYAIHPEYKSPRLSEPSMDQSLLSANFSQGNIFDSIPTVLQDNEHHVVGHEKEEKRSTLIRDVFNTVKIKVLYWFENIDDEKLDK